MSRLKPPTEVTVEKRSTFGGPFTWIYIVGLLLAVTCFGVGLYLALDRGNYVMLAAGCASVIAIFVSWPITSVLNEFRQIAVKREEDMAAVLAERLQQISVMLNMISENQLLSDRAKSVAFREKDRDALRRAIQEEVAKHDYEAALVLADDIESVFGYKQEADRVRSEIDAKRNEAINKQVNDALAVIDRHARAENWSDAMREAERVAQAMPGIEAARRLPQEVGARRDAHKRHLQESWREAANRNDIDGAIEILRNLDPYLTPTEAESMKDTVRGIFKQKLQILAAQFTANIHNPAEAVRIGEEIIRDFPNTRIAHEVGEKMSALRAQASGSPVPASV